MKYQVSRNAAGDIAGYRIELSAHETEQWAYRAGHAWLGSAIAGNPIAIEVDDVGFLRSEPTVPLDELVGIVCDHLPKECHHLWPVWDHPDMIRTIIPMDVVIEC